MATIVFRRMIVACSGGWCSSALGSVLLVCCTTRLASQTPPPTFEPRDEVPALVSFFAPFVFPKVIQDVYRLKAYVRSEGFASFRATHGDLFAVDAIFDQAMRLSWNNAYEALLLSLAATMDHRRFGVNIPVLGPLLWVPLTSEFEEEFRDRVRSLPRALYPDSPTGGAQDRDKLQHFFGSAFLAHVFESRSAAQRIGEFIEWGEERIIVDGALDERDFRANAQGQEFGLRLLEDKNAMPSTFFRLAPAQLDSPATTPPDSLVHKMELR
jgi:hypothetical protein